MKVTDLHDTEYHTYYKTYIGLIPDNRTLLEGFEKGLEEVVSFFKGIPEDKLNYAYAEDKWSVKDVFQHIIDTERIFQYRCFCIARHDKTALPGYDENYYAFPAQANAKSLDALIEEFTSVRYSFIVLLKSLSAADLQQEGNANNSPITARAAAFIVLGHALWHMEVIKNRYLQ
ncbi:DinB family protein [Aestuariibaculum suncheonense]|uniref:DinB family protein n=1 Tax=Aestuariibaculum suncheonense TaxID=1028745 RepID=A0A8J6Q6U6_9FLAO|nr:DinB family protein [Aestuariibaculum suncheonense]MBD0835748.1 DinB family protein [Aestuariibaculum suncheonense]